MKLPPHVASLTVDGVIWQESGQLYPLKGCPLDRTPLILGRAIGSLVTIGRVWLSFIFIINKLVLFPQPVIAFSYFLLTAQQFETVWPLDQFGPVALLICLDCLTTMLPFLLSVFYHLFMCHRSGPTVYHRLLKVDVFGVWMTTTFGSFSVIYCGMYCWPILRHTFTCIYMLLSAAVLYSMMNSQSKQGRVLPLMVQYFFRLAGLLFRITPWGGGHPFSLSFYLLMEVVAIPGAMANALHIPERWLPGKLDYALNGHSLMHIAAFLCMYLGKRGFLLDMEWLNSHSHCPK